MTRNFSGGSSIEKWYCLIASCLVFKHELNTIDRLGWAVLYVYVDKCWTIEERGEWPWLNDAPKKLSPKKSPVESAKRVTDFLCLCLDECVSSSTFDSCVSVAYTFSPFNFPFPLSLCLLFVQRAHFSPPHLSRRDHPRTLSSLIPLTLRLRSFQPLVYFILCSLAFFFFLFILF